jgi:hypothetical protein
MELMLDFSYTKVAGVSPIPIVRLYFMNPKNNLLTDNNDLGIVDTGSDITVVSYAIVSRLQLKPLQMKKNFIFRGLGQLNTGIPYLIKISFDSENFIDAKVIAIPDDILNGEVIIGRNILNRFLITFDGPRLTFTIAD